MRRLIKFPAPLIPASSREEFEFITFNLLYVEILTKDNGRSSNSLRHVSILGCKSSPPTKRRGMEEQKSIRKGRKIDSLYSVWCSRGGHVRRIRTDENPFFIKEKHTGFRWIFDRFSSPGHNVPRAKFVFHLIFLPEEYWESRRKRRKRWLL